VSNDRVLILVSRAIAVIQGITALLEISYLPERLMWFYHSRPRNTLEGPQFLDVYHSTGIGMLCFRIAALLALTYVFWQCGPRVRAFLLTGERNEISPENRHEIQSL
jgi:hypothetical protein